MMTLRSRAPRRTSTSSNRIESATSAPGSTRTPGEMMELTTRQSVSEQPVPTIDERRSAPEMKVGGYWGL